jgi:hypothetical protein
LIPRKEGFKSFYGIIKGVKAVTVGPLEPAEARDIDQETIRWRTDKISSGPLENTINNQLF